MKGPNYTLNLEFETVVEAPSFEEALKPHTDWPITESYDHATATAWNPGTCMYYQEMWEAALLPEAILTASHGSVEQVVDMKQQLNQLRDSLMKSE